MSLMFENGDLREDLRLPEGDLGKEIQSKFENSDDFLVSYAGSRSGPGQVPVALVRLSARAAQQNLTSEGVCCDIKYQVNY